MGITVSGYPLLYISDLMVSFTASAYYSSEKQGYAMICAKIVTGVLGRPIWVYASTVNGTATGEGNNSATDHCSDMYFQVQCILLNSFISCQFHLCE